MNNIKWEDGAVCFANGLMHFYSGDIEIIERHAGKYGDFQLNEIRQGDYIEASELDTEQKYNDAVEVFELFGFDCSGDSGFPSDQGYSHAFCSKDTGINMCYEGGFNLHCTGKKITYPQLMAIGKLKRAMIERDSMSGPNSGH